VREIERFGPSADHGVVHDAGRREQIAELESANIIITSYALLRATSTY